MDFIMEYYIWIVAGFVILLMTIIGYIADNSDYMEKQQKKNKQKKEAVVKQKKERMTPAQKAFNKEVGDGKNLVLEESMIHYPIDFDYDEERMDIVDSVDEEKVSDEDIETKSSNDSLNSLPAVGLANYVMKEETKIEKEKENHEELNSSDIEKPLENGVLNLDLYDTNESDISSEHIETDSEEKEDTLDSDETIDIAKDADMLDKKEPLNQEETEKDLEIYEDQQKDSKEKESIEDSREHDQEEKTDEIQYSEVQSDDSMDEDELWQF